MRDALHILVQSLSGPEKAYLKKYTSAWKKADKSYWQLYEAVLGAKEWKEEEIRKMAGYDTRPGRFAVAKHELYELLLRVLRGYHLKSNPRATLRSKLDQIELLQARGLHAQALKRIRSTRKQALASDAFFQLAQLIRAEQQSVKALSRRDLHQRLAQLLEDERENFRRIHEETELRILHHQLFAFLSANVDQRKPEDAATIATLVGHPLVTKPEPPDFFSGQLFYHSIQANHTRLSGDTVGFQVRMGQLMEVWEQRPDRIRMGAEKFVANLITYLDACLHNGDFDSYELRHGALEEIGKDKRIDRAFLFQVSLQLELRYCLNKPDTSRALELDGRLREGLHRYGEGIMENFRLALFYNIMVLLFIAGHFAESQRWARTILAQAPKGLRQDIHFVARIFSMLLKVELGDWEGLEEDLGRSGKFFQRKGAWMDFEQLVVRHLRKVMEARTVERGDAWQSFWEELRGLDAGELIGYEEVLKWVEGKCE